MDFLLDSRYLFVFVWVSLCTALCVGLTLYSRSTAKRSWRQVKYTFNLGVFEVIATFVLLILSMAVFYHYGTEIRKVGSVPEQIGGFISEKYFVDGDHQESYQECHGTGDDRTCTTKWKTVYHRDFFLENTTGDWWSGSKWSARVNTGCRNCEPYRVPAEYEVAYVGMPVSLDHYYSDYITAVTEKDNEAIYSSFSLVDVCPEKPYIKLNWHQTGRILFSVGFSETLKEQYLAWNFAPRESRDFCTSKSTKQAKKKVIRFGIYHYCLPG